MKFRLLLWALGLLMARASRNDPTFRKKLEGKDLVFQLSSEDDVARHYRVKDLRVRSRCGRVESPAFGIQFKNAAEGFRALTAKNTQLVFMQGIQNQDIVILGNPALMMWFQSLAKHLFSRGKTSSKTEKSRID